MGGIGPMFDLLGFFHRFAGKDYADKRPRYRYEAGDLRAGGVHGAAGSGAGAGDSGAVLI